ncbi:MAG: response regulator [Elusimicrobia bacterium]|nr:response regulator [Elusimicrobiota bacterium]
MKKIVVVDDDPAMRELIADILGPHYEVLKAEDGAAGLELVKKAMPDLVVLDLLMPRMHGFEVCQKIKADETLRRIKVLISSSKSYSKDIQTAKQAGADGYIVKPYAIDELLGQVKILLEKDAKALELKFWGTRGSIASPGPQTLRYGGNTPCTSLRAGDDLLILDAGTGIRELGQALAEESQGRPLRAHLLIGHTHWDHIQGLPFFGPLYAPQNKFTIYGTHGTTQKFEDVLSGQMHPTYFPVSFRDLDSKVETVELSGPWEMGAVKARYHYLNHPGITIGFRLETKDWSVCYLSDHEPYSRLNAKGEFSVQEDLAVAEFASGCDLLISEAQYTEEEYRAKKSWGHSTFADVVGLAAKAGVKNLALFHHDPSHTDEMMDRFVAECREHVAKGGHSFNCFAAQEGMRVTL